MRFLFAGLATVGGVIALFFISFGDMPDLLHRLEARPEAAVAQPVSPPPMQATAMVMPEKPAAPPASHESDAEHAELQAKLLALQAQLRDANESVASLHSQAAQQREQLAKLQQQREEEQARLAKLKADQEAAEQARKQAAEQAQQQAAEQARQQAAEQARKQAAEQAQQQAAEQARQQAAEQARQQAAEQARKQAAEQARQQAAEQAKRDAQEAAAREAKAAAAKQATPAPGRDVDQVKTASAGSQNQGADTAAAQKPAGTSDRSAVPQQTATRQRAVPEPKFASAAPAVPQSADASTRQAPRSAQADRQAGTQAARALPPPVRARDGERQYAEADPGSMQAVLDRLRHQPTQPYAQRPDNAPSQNNGETWRNAPAVTASSAYAPARERLGRARSAIASGHMGEAQQLLEEAQLQLVFRPVTPDGAEAASGSRAASDVAEALSMLGSGQDSIALRYIDRAMAETGREPQQASLPRYGSGPAPSQGDSYARY